MSAACLQLTEATLGFPNCYDDGKTEVTLWGPETIHAMPGAAAWMRDDDAYRKLLLLVMESGMHWEGGQWKEAVINHIFEMEEWEEHGTAYEKWCQEEANMDDLHEKSLFTEWNQATGESNFIGAEDIKKNMKIPEFTPEMLLQRDMLNYFFNFKWNQERFPGCPNTRFEENMEVPEQIELLELVAVGDNHGVAKCLFGAVYVPKSALTHLWYNGGCEIGTIFDGEITFTPENKFPWRLKRDGITFTYQDMCGTRPDDY